LEAKNLLKEK